MSFSHCLLSRPLQPPFQRPFFHIRYYIQQLKSHPSADLGDALTTDRQVISTVKPWVANSAYKLGPGLMYMMRATAFLLVGQHLLQMVETYLPLI